VQKLLRFLWFDNKAEKAMNARGALVKSLKRLSHEIAKRHAGHAASFWLAVLIEGSLHTPINEACDNFSSALRIRISLLSTKTPDAMLGRDLANLGKRD
jgi:hypothetical protein